MRKACDSFINCNEKKVVLFEKNEYSIMDCIKCGHRSAKIYKAENHIEQVFSDDYFFAGKQGYPNYLHQKDILFKYGIKYAKIISKYATPGKMLDVGSAAGFILKGFEQSGWICHGLEPNYSMASYGRNELKLDITTGNLESFKTTQRFNLVNMIQVIGHFVDLDKALQNVSHLLNKNGLVLIESWDMKSIIARIMGKHWHEYCPPSVINWFSDETLTQLLNYYGFRLITQGRPSKKINIKHGLSVFDENTSRFIFKKQIIKFLSRTIGKFNINYPLFDLKWYLFKKL